MKKFFLFFWIIIFISCDQKKETKPSVDINDIARQYVKLALNIGKYDGDFVDAYYGPDSLKPDTIKLAAFPKDSFLNAVDNSSISSKKFNQQIKMILLFIVQNGLQIS